MEAACDVLGLKPPLFLDCPDGGVERHCRDSARGQVVRFLREREADVVVTFGPDGVSGHADHVAIGEIVTAAAREFS
jgi:LmbE family N-acetylglucosaminyl deacetylase